MEHHSKASFFAASFGGRRRNRQIKGALLAVNLFYIYKDTEIGKKMQIKFFYIMKIALKFYI